MNPGLALAVEAMEVYLRARPEGKLLHDPLAAAAMIDSSSFTWAEVDVFREQGRWGSIAKKGTNTWISTSVAIDQALSSLTGMHTTAPRS